MCLSVCVSDVDKAWAKFRQKKYTSFIITEGVGEDGEPIETIEDTVNDLSKFNNILYVVHCAADIFIGFIQKPLS